MGYGWLEDNGYYIKVKTRPLHKALERRIIDMSGYNTIQPNCNLDSGYKEDTINGSSLKDREPIGVAMSF